MADIYSNILRDTTEAVASSINNNLNIVMKFLATVTLVISVPNIIFSAYGMNVRSESMPFADSPYGFPIYAALPWESVWFWFLLWRKRSFSDLKGFWKKKGRK